MKRTILPFLILILGSLSSYAVENKAFNLCAGSPKEFALLKTQLPAEINQLPIHLGSLADPGIESNPVVVEILDYKEALLLDTKLQNKGSVYHDKLEIKKLCFDKDTKDLKLTIANDTEIRFQHNISDYAVSGLKLKVLTKEQTAKLNAQLNAGTPVPDANGSTK